MKTNVMLAIGWGIGILIGTFFTSGDFSRAGYIIWHILCFAILVYYFGKCREKPKSKENFQE